MNAVLTWILENWLNQVTCALEVVLILVCVHGVFKEKLRISASSILLLVFELVTLAFINAGILPMICTVLTYLYFGIYCKYIFKRKVLDTIGKVVISFLLAGAIEIASSIIANPFGKMFSNPHVRMLFINVIGVLLAGALFKAFRSKIKKRRIELDKEKWGALVVVAGTYLAITIIDYRLRGEVDQIYYFLFFISCLVVCIVTIHSQQARYDWEKKKMEIEMRKVYDDTYKELILEVRKRQHDFKNQLTAIYSMHLNATTLEELVERQKQYGDVLIHKSRYDRILFGCDNSILSGYLYYRFIALEKENIQVDYQINVEEALCRLPLYEVIEILGILTTNAVEYYESNDQDKIIKLIMKETMRYLYIEVPNKAQKYGVNEIEKMFGVGYSTKGKNRGLGLPRLKELSEKADADIIVDNRSDGENNWIVFSIAIPKNEGE